MLIQAVVTALLVFLESVFFTGCITNRDGNVHRETHITLPEISAPAHIYTRDFISGIYAHAFKRPRKYSGVSATAPLRGLDAEYTLVRSFTASIPAFVAYKPAQLRNGAGSGVGIASSWRRRDEYIAYRLRL